MEAVVKGDSRGLKAEITAGSPKTFDLSDLKGRYVKIFCGPQAIRFNWTDSGDATLDTSTTGELTITEGIPDGAAAGFQGEHRVVPKDKPRLTVDVESGTEMVYVKPVSVDKVVG